MFHDIENVIGMAANGKRRGRGHEDNRRTYFLGHVLQHERDDAFLKPTFLSHDDFEVDLGHILHRLDECNRHFDVRSEIERKVEGLRVNMLLEDCG